MKFWQGSILNLGLHQERVNRAFQVHFSEHPPIQLMNITIPDDWKGKVGKCRLVYDRNVIKTEFSSPTVFNIITLKIVESPAIDYAHKYEDRSQLEGLYHSRGAADEIIISVDGRVTDSFYANLVFQDNEKWVTPKYPLLKGTKRRQLLEEGKIIERDINVDDISGFQTVGLINAMLDLGQVSVDMADIN